MISVEVWEFYRQKRKRLNVNNEYCALKGTEEKNKKKKKNKWLMCVVCLPVKWIFPLV